LCAAAPVRPQGAPKKRNAAYLKGCGDRILRTKRSNGVDFWPGSKWQLKKKKRPPFSRFGSGRLFYS
jgi:hypothetical protein